MHTFQEQINKLKETHKVYLWDKEFSKKTEDIILEFLNMTDEKDPKKLLRIIMTNTQGKLNPVIIDKIIKENI